MKASQRVQLIFHVPVFTLTGYAQMVSLACHWLDMTSEAARPEEKEKNREGVKLDELYLLEQVRTRLTSCVIFQQAC